MAVDTGDLVPRASGSASLGVEMVNGMGGLTRDIRPYAQVHQLSGVLHYAGGSGVLRFGYDDSGDRAIQCSTDGGLTFGELPHSGQIQESIDAALIEAGVTPHTLQAAYDGGNEMLIDNDPAGYHGPLVLQNETGRLLPGLSAVEIDQIHLDYAIGISGSAVDINNPDSFAFTAIRAGAILLKSSGLLSPANSLHMGFDEEGISNAAFITTSGSLNVQADSLLIMESFFGSVTLQSRASSMTLSTTDQNGPGGDISLASVQDIVTSAGDDETGLGGQIELNAFRGSGQLDYRFGPHQSWYTKQTHSSTSGPFGDGFNPLVPSGQIIQMILENAPAGSATTLQEAYDAGRTIFIDGNNDLEITGGDSKFKLGTNGVNAPVQLSGVLDLHTTQQRGDLTHMITSNFQDGFTAPTSVEEAAARSLGLGDIAFVTASGVTNLRVGSGIAEFVNPIAQTDLTVAAGETPINWDFSQSDTHYLIDSNSDIMILVPGNYRISYYINTSQGVGSTRTIVRGRAVIGGTPLLRSTAYGYSRITTAPEATTGKTFLVNFFAGQILQITVTNLDTSTLGTIVGECSVIIERLGPIKDAPDTGD